MNRFEFANFGFTWLFALDPRYPNTIVKAEPFMQHGPAGTSLWYVHEVFARAEYYARLTATNPAFTSTALTCPRSPDPKARHGCFPSSVSR